MSFRMWWIYEMGWYDLSKMTRKLRVNWNEHIMKCIRERVRRKYISEEYMNDMQ